MIGEVIAETILGFIAEFIVLIFVSFIWKKLLNYTGGTVRWIYGTIWRTIAQKPKFRFSEYIHGPENPADWFDAQHTTVNSTIGFLSLTGLIVWICL